MNFLAVALFDHPRNSHTATFSLLIGRRHCRLSKLVTVCNVLPAIAVVQWAREDGRKKKCWVATPGMGIAHTRVFISLVFPAKSAPPDINYQMWHRGVRDKVWLSHAVFARIAWVCYQSLPASFCPGKFRKQNGGQRHEFLGFWLLLLMRLPGSISVSWADGLQI